MAALEVGAHLDFVDGDKRNVEVERHRLDRRHPITRLFRLDFLFARDERDLLGADLFDDAIIDFARKKPQRQANQSRRMRHHPLDGEMGLAGIGWAQNCRDASAAQARFARLERKRGCH